MPYLWLKPLNVGKKRKNMAARLPDVPCSFILTSPTVIWILHTCLVRTTRLPRAQAERAEVYLYKAAGASVTGARPAAPSGGPGLSPEEERV